VSGCVRAELTTSACSHPAPTQAANAEAAVRSAKNAKLLALLQKPAELQSTLDDLERECNRIYKAVTPQSHL
jgi:hypothetical protein